MQTERCRDPGRCSVWDYEPAPEVWWSEDGIDALLWADAPPYKQPVESPIESAAIEPAGEAQ